MHGTHSNQNVDDDIGQFLVVHNPGPHIEQTDSVEAFDFDVRQDAVYRCLCAFRKNGLEIDDESLIPTLITHKYAAAMNLKNARIDAIRRLRGRGSQRGKDKRIARTFASRDLEHVWIPEDEHLGIDTAAPCPEAARCYEDVENNFGEELRRIYDHATELEQKAMRVLAEWQRRKECGENTYPLRKTVHKLKARLLAEGSAFDLSPRFL